jgi:hypothetical protein
VLAGYAIGAGDRLGAIDFVMENVGPSTAYIKLMTYDGTTSPSGWKLIDTSVPTGTDWYGTVLAAGGAQTKSYVLLNKRVGFFGSGNTLVNISTVIRNKADLRGAQVDIVAVGRRGWGYDQGYNKAELKKKWGSITSVSTASNASAGEGIISSTENTGPTGP